MGHNRTEQNNVTSIIFTLPPYVLRRHPRAKRLRISVGLDGSVTVTIPTRVSTALAERFVREKSDWIAAKRKHAAALNIIPLPKFAQRDELAHKKTARALVHRLVESYSIRYGFKPGRLSIRNQRTRWGSCTNEGNISINYRIIFLPPELQTYVIVHELAHTSEHNHSKKFWLLVGGILPDYVTLRRQLRSRRLG